MTGRVGSTVLAVDPGTKRIGVAISDPTGKVALPVTVVPRVGDRHIKQLSKLIQERSVDEIIVGLPRNLRGEEGAAAEKARALASELEAEVGLPVHMFDERMTTLQARAALREAGLKERHQRSFVDKIAATLLLQAFLDARTAAETRG